MFLLISTHIFQENHVQVKVHRLSEGAIQLTRDEIAHYANSRTILQIIHVCFVRKSETVITG